MRDKIRDHLSARVLEASVRDEVDCRVMGRLWASVGRPVLAGVCTQVEARVWHPVGAHVVDQVIARVGDLDEG